MPQTNSSINMLNEIYQAASMGAQASELLINKTEDSQFSQKLHDYSNRYNMVKNEAASMLSERGEVPRDAGVMEKSSLWMGVQLNTLMDKTSSHMAEMLIQGSTMGIIKGERHKNTHTDADADCVNLEDKFLALQKEHIDDMKKFLR